MSSKYRFDGSLLECLGTMEGDVALVESSPKKAHCLFEVPSQEIATVKMETAVVGQGCGKGNAIGSAIPPSLNNQPRPCHSKVGTEVREPRSRKAADDKVPIKSMEKFIKGKLSTDYEWATEWLLEIYWRQTPYEQVNGSTEDANGVGFNSCDAGFLSSLARQSEKSNWLSDSQVKCLHRIIPRYWGQVLEILGRDAVMDLMREEP